MPRTKYNKEGALTLTIQQVAKELAISEYLTERMVKSGQIRSVRFGKLRRIPRIALDELLRGEKPN